MKKAGAMLTRSPQDRLAEACHNQAAKECSTTLRGLPPFKRERGGLKEKKGEEREVADGCDRTKVLMSRGLLYTSCLLKGGGGKLGV